MDFMLTKSIYSSIIFKIAVKIAFAIFFRNRKLLLLTFYWPAVTGHYKIHYDQIALKDYLLSFQLGDDRTYLCLFIVQFMTYLKTKARKYLPVYWGDSSPSPTRIAIIFLYMTILMAISMKRNRAFLISYKLSTKSSIN
jgi:hypothetical protein